MKRRRSCQESEATWKTLIGLSPRVQAETTETDQHDDLFDCRSLAVPQTRTLVEDVLNDHTKKWKDLDHRKIVKDPPPLKASENKLARAVRFKRQLDLPDNFDYETKLTAPPTPGKNDDLVIDLLDPTLQESHHQELWKLFSKVPTVETIKEHDRSNAQIPHTLKVYNEIVEGTKRSRRLDAHGLARLRMSDRHGLPPPSLLQQASKNKKPDTSTIRLEFWKRQPKRGSYPEWCRMVLEFLASQTLLDVHMTIVQMTEDDAWTFQQEEHDDSGFFFIENQFYSTGKIDYTGPIIQWIDGRGPPNPARRQFLGITTMENFTVTPMNETILGKIPFRLGFRYYHVTHGDVECSFFATDKRLTHHANIPYPIIHDIWTQPYTPQLCKACNRHPAVYAYKANASHCSKDKRTALCENCCTQLNLFEKEKDSLELYSTWKNRSELSVALSMGILRGNLPRFF